MFKSLQNVLARIKNYSSVTAPSVKCRCYKKRIKLPLAFDAQTKLKSANDLSCCLVVLQSSLFQFSINTKTGALTSSGRYIQWIFIYVCFLIEDGLVKYWIGHNTCKNAHSSLHRGFVRISSARPRLISHFKTLEQIKFAMKLNLKKMLKMPEKSFWEIKNNSLKVGSAESFTWSKTIS